MNQPFKNMIQGKKILFYRFSEEESKIPTTKKFVKVSFGFTQNDYWKEFNAGSGVNSFFYSN
jgi:hypothetical protein